MSSLSTNRNLSALQVLSEWEARRKVNLSGHAEHICFVADDRGRVWAYDQTEVGNVFRMVSAAIKKRAYDALYRTWRSRHLNLYILHLE